MDSKSKLEDIVKSDPYYIKLIDVPSIEIQLIAVRKDGSLLQYIKDPCEEVKWAALKSNVWSVQYIDNPTEEMCIYAVEKAWNALKLIKDPSPEVIMKALESKGWAIQYVKDPSEEMQVAAVKKDWDSIKYIANPSRSAAEKAVNLDWRAIKYIRNAPIDMKISAISQDEEAVRYMDLSQADICLLLEKNIKILKYIGCRITTDELVNILKKMLGSNDIDSKYVVDFLECDIPAIEKVKFIRNFGSTKAKAALVDYKLKI